MKRYTMEDTSTRGWDANYEMVEDIDGDYYRVDDVDAALAAKDQEIARLQRILRNCVNDVIFCKTEGEVCGIEAAKEYLAALAPVRNPGIPEPLRSIVNGVSRGMER